jgi:hypothetical protein
MLTQKCIINVCTREIRQGLEKLGYSYDKEGAAYGGNTVIYTAGNSYFMKKDIKSLKRDRSPRFICSCIDCGMDGDLFLALAALRDDAVDLGQWFVIDTDGYADLPEGKWFKTDDMDYPYYAGVRADPLHCHKASREEIMRHFKDAGQKRR